MRLNNRGLQMFQLVQQWEPSRESATRFGEKHGLSKGCVLYWTQQYRKAQEQGLYSDLDPNQAFVPLTMHQQNTTPSPKNDLAEVTLKNGVTLRLPVQSLAQILSSLGQI